MRGEYLIFNLFIFLSSTIAVWLHPHSKKIDIWTAFQSIAAIALPFVIADIIVTNWFWSFNSRYVLGFLVLRVPIEELLFFFTVPWACLQIWVNMEEYFAKKINIERIGIGITAVLGILTIWGMINQAWYTATISGVAGVLSVFIPWKHLKKAYFLFGLAVLILTAIFNMYLTARPIVTYNREMITNLRIGTIPVEDFVYGLVLTTGVVVCYEKRKIFNIKKKGL